MTWILPSAAHEPLPACVSGRVLDDVDDVAGVGRKVASISLFGGACSGKTSLLEVTCRRMRNRLRIGVIVAGAGAREDAARLRQYAASVFALDTSNPSPAAFHEALERAEFDELDLLLVECAAEWSPKTVEPLLGQSGIVRLVSVMGDSAADSLHRMLRCDLLLLTKSDLLPFMPLDACAFHEGVKRGRPGLPMIDVSSATGQGLGEWYQWLDQRVRPVQSHRRRAIRPFDYFVG